MQRGTPLLVTKVIGLAWSVIGEPASKALMEGLGKTLARYRFPPSPLAGPPKIQVFLTVYSHFSA